MSSPIPLNYRVAAAQVSQFIEGSTPDFYNNQNSALSTIANSNPGTSTVAWVNDPTRSEVGDADVQPQYPG